MIFTIYFAPMLIVVVTMMLLALYVIHYSDLHDE
ncbi:hypothetical protein C7820_6379 [Paenibacillus sp. VMFN-D1]|uniref:Uncharacterized protein n=1 Tax=Paenibacillus favisporus TaxID=221028 RepID=A0ABV2FE07_9BACL|nr:hypothetical protein C7820_6379 [Paenibacillus sp. VMFN-D1]